MTGWPDARLSVFFLICLLVPAPAAAQQAGASVVVRGPVHDNLYAAGGEVDVRAEADADVVAAGGRVVIDGVVGRDVLAGGGDVTIRGRVGDDVRVAGGMVTVVAPIAGELLAAGGRVRLAPETTVAGRVWLAGGDVEVRGRIGKALRVAGGRIRLDGQVDGDVELVGGDVEIGSGARISGRLTYRSPHQAKIDPGALITGGITYIEPKLPRAVARTASIVVNVAGLLWLMVTGVVLLLLFPGVFARSARTIATNPWKSLGLGLAVLVVTPVVVMVLFFSVLGIPLAFTATALYAVALLIGFLVAAVFLGDMGGLLRQRRPSPGGQIVRLLAALIVLTLARWIPVVGGLILFLALLFGLGALALESHRAYAGPSAHPLGVPE
jgi:cytoskeletal protein CcmA (bactofilin family)